MTDATQAAEGALISALLVDPSQIPVVASMLSMGALGTRRYREIYDAMVRLSSEGKSVDAVTLRSLGHDTVDIVLQHQGRAIPEYVDIIQDGAFRRVVESNLDEARRLLISGSRPDFLHYLHDLTRRLGEAHSGGQTFDVERALMTYDVLRAERKLKGVGLPYGIATLDRWLQPAHGGDMIVAAARPSVGKTVLAEHIADQWAWESDYPVMFVSIEMSLGQLMDRAVSRWGDIPSAHIVRGVLTQDEERSVEVTLETRRSVNLWYVDNPYSTTTSVRMAAAEIELRAGGLRGIIIDYLQLLGDAGDNDNQRVGRISRNLKALAREHDCPVLVLSQLNRQSEYRKDAHPRLADIRDSGAVEQDADVVLGLYRSSLTDDTLEIDILKNRQGPLNRVYVEFDGSHVRLNTEE